MEALLDNDLLRKLTRYGLLHEFERLLAVRGYDEPHRRVPTAPWALRVVRGRISTEFWPDPAQAEVLRMFLERRSAGATGSDEDALVALNVLGFDAGELQLVAYALDHPSSIVFTGDKRAIRVVCNNPRLAAVKARMSGRFVHLNTVMRDISNRIGWTRVASGVTSAVVPGSVRVDLELDSAYALASEREMDGAVSSSIAALRAQCPGMLMPGTP